MSEKKIMSSTTKGGEEDIIIPIVDVAEKKKKKKKKKKPDSSSDANNNIINDYLTDSNTSSNMPTTSAHNGSIGSSSKKKKKKKKNSGIDNDSTNDLSDSNTSSNMPITSGHSGSSSKKRKNKKNKDSDYIDVHTTNDDMADGSNTSNSLPTTSSVKKRKKKKKNSNTNSADISNDPSSTIITMSEKKIVSSITKGREDEDVIAIPVADSVVPVVVENVAHVNKVNAFQVPSGRWKNGLLSCCSACLCPCLMGWCCYPILLGQVVERLKYATCSDRKSWPVCWIFAILWMIVIIIEIFAFYFYATFVFFVPSSVFWDDDDSYTKGDDYLSSLYDDDNYTYYINTSTSFYSYQILSFVMAVCVWFICIISCCTRMKMRKQYQIEPICCGDNCCDDCCISL